MILDCDPGHDDAVAIVTAAHVADVAGIVTVGGNVDIDLTTHNALVMRDLVGIDAPVHRGAGHPIVAKPHHAAAVHGVSGLDGADLPAPVTPLDGTDGVEFIIDTCRAEEGLWLVPIGPLTNIGLAFRLAPDLPDRIAGVSLMGGGSFGNRSAVAEFNIWADPHAAAIVFDAYDPATPGSAAGTLIMAGLDVTHRFQLTPERIERTRELPGPARRDPRRPVRVLLGALPVPPQRRRDARCGTPRPARRPGGDAPRPVRPERAPRRGRDGRRTHRRDDRHRRTIACSNALPRTARSSSTSTPMRPST